MCASIVGFVDLTLPEAGAALDAHMAASPRFRGIRHASGWDASEEVRNSHTNPTEGLLADGAFRAGFAELGRRGLTFDAWMYHAQIRELTALARAFPDQPIVLDHFGGPLGIGPYAGRREEIFAAWKDDVAELARCENVVAKLGGLVMPINGFGFHKRETPATSDELVAATREYYLHMIDRFGPDRCMFESNFPVDKQSCSYHVLYNSFKKIAAGCSAAGEGRAVPRHRGAGLSGGGLGEGLVPDSPTPVEPPEQRERDGRTDELRHDEGRRVRREDPGERIRDRPRNGHGRVREGRRGREPVAGRDVEPHHGGDRVRPHPERPEDGREQPERRDALREPLPTAGTRL